MTKTVLVTGAAGFIGSHLVDSLLDQGHRVIGIDNFRTGREENLKRAHVSSSFTLIRADICDPNLISEVPEDIDCIFHLAAIASVELSVEDPLLINHNNVTGTVNVLDLARRRDIRRIVFVSSAAVYGAPETLPVTEESPLHALSPYGASKIAGEAYTKAFRNSYGFEAVILRYFNVYGPRQAFSEYSGVVSIFVNQALQNEDLIINGDGHQIRSFIYVDDVVTFTIRASEILEADGMTMNIAGTENITVREIAKKVLNLVPESKSKIVYGPPRAGDIRVSRGAIDRACSVLGIRPQVSFEEGLQRTINWYKVQQNVTN